MAKKLSNIKIEDARIMFRNFSGRPTQFNSQGGAKGFAVVIDPAVAEELIKDGWNIKFLTPREDGEEPLPILNVSIRYGVVNPMIYMVTKNHKELLNDQTVPLLDSAEIDSVDVIITPYTWQVGSKTGVKAYVKTMYVKVVEDEFADKYNFDEPSANNEEDLPW